MKKVFLLTCCLLATSFIHAQSSFEGYVVYKMTPQNPNKQLISDRAFYARTSSQ